MTDEATPRPWRTARLSNIVDAVHILDANGNLLLTEIAKDTASMIVRAVNNHEGLRDNLGYLLWCAEDDKGIGLEVGLDPEQLIQLTATVEGLRQARAAWESARKGIGARQGGTSNDELVETLKALLEHYDALSGATAHHVGCECGGTPDGEHCCQTFVDAWRQARAVLDKITNS